VVQMSISFSGLIGCLRVMWIVGSGLATRRALHPAHLMALCPAGFISPPSIFVSRLPTESGQPRKRFFASRYNLIVSSPRCQAQN